MFQSEGLLSKGHLPTFILVTTRYRFAISLSPSDLKEFNLNKTFKLVVGRDSGFLNCFPHPPHFGQTTLSILDK